MFAEQFGLGELGHLLGFLVGMYPSMFVLVFGEEVMMRT